MKIVAVAVTAAGAAVARRLPYEFAPGPLAAVVRARWSDVDGFVLVAATGIAVRVVGPLLADKRSDPAVVCVDDAARFAIALAGGHAAGNQLTREVAGLLGAEPVVTTATDLAGLPALDLLPGFVAVGDIAGVTRGWLDGQAPSIEAELDWPVPLRSGAGPGRVIVTDRRIAPAPGVVALHPPSLVIGVGASTNAPATEAVELLAAVLAESGLALESVTTVATIDRRAADPVVTALGLPVRSFTATALAVVEVPNPSEVVATEVGTPSVAEAAALLAAGPGAELIVVKHKARAATVAIARRARPEGHLAVVGLGPGHARHRTPAASAAVRAAQVVIGYDLYLDQCTDLLTAAQTVLRSPIGAEVDRCRDALRRAAAGEDVVLVCSGDPGVFAMATLVLELAPSEGSPPVDIVPGITAGSAAAAILGAPFGHDHAYISLSDLLTSWELIERRLQAVADGDLAVALYNPRSQRRTWQLDRAREILLTGRPASTPVGVVTDATRPEERVQRTTLGELDADTVGMLSVVIVGSSTTTVVGDRIVTPRGYQP
jgi:cobalt-precorrin 5A hydrolase/precorrin-3B C17-methyltransferase